MNVAIIGGKLQGLEACYLARKAGWNTILIDTNIHTPAYNLCHDFLQFDIHTWQDRVQDLRNIDIIVPALEDWPTLQVIARMSDDLGIPLLFDHQAYSVSSSKRCSYNILAQIGIPVPPKWPECEFPVITRPDGQSGSKDVQIFTEQSPELQEILQNPALIAEQYISGELYSLEVIGVPGQYQSIQVTDLVLDPTFDCQRVIAPSLLSEDQTAIFADQAKEIAQAVQLHGIMDVEAIVHDGQLITIEIDARLPSQTPTAVYWSCDYNILKESISSFLHARKPAGDITPKRYVVYEHIAVQNKHLSFCGEHCIAQSKNLELIDHFMGADEAITNVHADPGQWTATLIFAASSWDELFIKRSHFYTQVCETFSLYPMEETDIYT